MVKKKKIKKVLIANRGEIAVRIIRSLRELGIQSVAVYSEADRASLHVQLADEAYCIGPAPSSESYLVIDKLIEVAKKSKADAIHPGYGFLSEKAPFSQACLDNDIIFLGPNPKPIQQMGDKIAARNAALKANVPMIPGTKGALSGFEEVKKLAKDFGYPVLLKASAGGGGKGMRVVENEKEIESAYKMAASEAKKAFNDDTMFMEKYLRNARHIEIQIACDQHGNGVHFFERECSLQRRHQKVIEEAPFFLMKDSTREKMTEASLRLAKSVGYSGVGTLEYLVDDDQNFYFLEMNTRLQVEHPVTELITGLDLVEIQIAIGEGRELPIKQSQITKRGHAIECRLYAEDPENNFFPSPGTIQWMTIPDGPGVRHDSAVYEGATIPIHYDPMIAKLVVWAASREQAIARMNRAIREYEIGGFRNNIPFLRTILENPDYIQGKVHTRYIDEHPELTKRRKVDLPFEIIMGVAAFDRDQSSKIQTSSTPTSSPSEISPWKLAGRRFF